MHLYIIQYFLEMKAYYVSVTNTSLLMVFRNIIAKVYCLLGCDTAIVWLIVADV
jgi:hypothetical protein